MRKSVREVAGLEEEALRQRRLMSRISDTLTRATGSAKSVALHGVGFAMWIGINAGLFTRIKPFDPFPFNFLTLVVSLEAIFLTLFVLISQNELTRLTDRRAHLDLQVNLLAERELTVMLKMLFGLSERHGLCDDELRAQVRELLEEPDLKALASDLDAKLPSA
jgi:uncharacterized membrane protein